MAMSQQHRRWLASGGKWYLISPLVYLRDALRAAGYTVYDLGDNSHLDALKPQDHTPYSETGWPIESKQPYVHAIDVMPKMKNGKKDYADLEALARKLIQDKRAGYAPFIKYMNWTTAREECFKTAWQPTEKTTTSTDKGHIHLSARSDYWNSGIKYSPFINRGGEDEPMYLGPFQLPMEPEPHVISPVQAGTANPNRKCWLNLGGDFFDNELLVPVRVFTSGGAGDWAALPGYKDGVVNLRSGKIFSQELPKGTRIVSFARMGYDVSGVPAFANDDPLKGDLVAIPNVKVSVGYEYGAPTAG